MRPAALIVLAVAAAFFDIRLRRIPDWICLAGFVAGTALNLQDSFIGAAVALTIGLPLWMLEIIRTDEVKLMGAVGSLAGPKGFAWIVVFSLVVHLVTRRKLSPAVAVVFGTVLWLIAIGLLPGYPGIPIARP